VTQPDAAFRFGSWLRRGAATQIAIPDGDTAGIHASLPITLTLNGGSQQASTTLELLGPGDITSFDSRAISRVWPPAGTLDAESNFFPLVEFAQPDLPWRYTPRKGDDSGRLRPWCCLVVLTDAELASFEPPRPDRALAAIHIASGTPMPQVAQSWAWAHTQISGNDGTSIDEIIRDAPERILARLLCPRRLDPKTTYWACLVPTFEVGRRAGLRLPIAPASAALAPAWTTTNGVLTSALELPVYHRWHFGTGPAGDFESLVRLLVSRPLPPTAGRRALDATAPGGALPRAADGPLMLGGALTSPIADHGPDPTSEFVEALADVLNLPAEVQAAGGDAVVAPPLYGTWHAQRARLQPGQQPPWFETLNADPRLRVPAALGALVVQDDQQALMASAWDQVAGIREANALLKKAQLARAIGQRLHARFVNSASTERVMQLATLLHAHIKVGNATAYELVRNSPPRAALFSAPLRRLVRARGPIGRRQARPETPEAPMIARVNDGTYDTVLVAVPLTPRIVSHDLVRAKTKGWHWPMTASAIKAAPERPHNIAWDPMFGAKPKKRVDAVDESRSMASFRSAAIAFAARSVGPGDERARVRLALPQIATRAAVAIDPTSAIPGGLRSRISAMLSFAWNPPDPIDPVMAYPVFPQPMYEALAARSPEWLLPGLGDVPANTVTVAETNDAFIEAYLVGLNHEMARELLWNEYPTDQRGSYFRQFWDPAGVVARPTPETAKDIAPLNAWPHASALGTHSTRPTPPGGKHLVLVVRSEVLRRYPDTIVYAQHAQITDGTYGIGTEQLAPAFGGRLGPDVAFFGFALDKVAARGTGTTADPGWFFVFQEQPHMPRFGLDLGAPDGSDVGRTPASWDDLSWPQLVAAGHPPSEIGYIDLGSSMPNTTALEVDGGPAWHLTAGGAGKPFARGADQAAITCQRPVRVAMHAAQMLLP
jgi:hypothetical protein